MSTIDDDPWAEVPKSMVAELAAWNNGQGTDLEGYISGAGNFSLAVGYATIFWPSFVSFEDYIFRIGFKEENVRGFEAQEGATPRSVEWIVNHFHLSDIHCHDSAEISSDKLVLLGNVLKGIYQAKLYWQFPQKPCVVEFYQPDNPDELAQYQISFWQKKHQKKD